MLAVDQGGGAAPPALGCCHGGAAAPLALGCCHGAEPLLVGGAADPPYYIKKEVNLSCIH